jgi:hypothetical protein
MVSERFWPLAFSYIYHVPLSSHLLKLLGDKTKGHPTPSDLALPSWLSSVAISHRLDPALVFKELK